MGGHIFWGHHAIHCGAAQVDLVVRNPPGNAGEARDLGSIPPGRSPEEEMATYSSIPGEKPIDRTEEPGRL